MPRCNDCMCANGRSLNKKKEDRIMAIRCRVTKTWVSPFADICSSFKERGKTRNGSGLEKIIERRREEVDIK